MGKLRYLGFSAFAILSSFNIAFAQLEPPADPPPVTPPPVDPPPVDPPPVDPPPVDPPPVDPPPVDPPPVDPPPVDPPPVDPPPVDPPPVDPPPVDPPPVDPPPVDPPPVDPPPVDPPPVDPPPVDPPPVDPPPVDPPPVDPPPSVETVDLYVFAGQSNMRGNVATRAADATGPLLIPPPYKTAFAAPVNWALQWNSAMLPPSGATDRTGSKFGTKFVPFRAAYDPWTKKPAKWGPEISFLYHRYQIDPRPIYFVKYAIGGTALYNNPNARNWNAAATADLSLLGALEDRVSPAVDALLAPGNRHVNVRLLWAQGESDVSSYGMVYTANFDALRAHLKARLERSNVTVSVDSMSLVANLITKNTRSAINVAATHAGSQVVNVFAYPPSHFLPDKLHLNALAQARHGREMELLTRTKPRIGIDNTATDVTTRSIRIPSKAGMIVSLPTAADGSIGVEILGDVSGLVVDALTGKISISDLALIQPGQRIIDVRRHTADAYTTSRLVLNFQY